MISRITLPNNIEEYKQVNSIITCLKRLRKQLMDRGFQKIAGQINACSVEKNISFICEEEGCKWNMCYRNVTKEYDDRNMYVLRSCYAIHNHKKDENKKLKEKEKDKHSVVFPDRKNKSQQILHDQRAFGFLNRILGLTYEQIGKYYAYLDDSICTTYLITRISYELRKMMGDPNKFTFHQWLQSKKSEISYISDLQYSCDDTFLELPTFFFLTTSSWKSLYQQRGIIMGVKTLEDRIIQQIDGVDYTCCFFYGMLPNLQLVIFALTVYKTQMLMTNNQKRKAAHLNIIGSDKTIKSQQKIDIGYYKSLRIFFKYMGEHCTTFITEHHQIIIKTTNYFLNKINKKRLFDQKKIIQHIVDPSNYIQEHLPDHLQQNALELTRLDNSEEMSQNTIREWLKNGKNIYGEDMSYEAISEEDVHDLEKFMELCRQRPIFGHENPALVGEWFGIYHNDAEGQKPIFNIRYLLGRMEWKMYKRTIAGILDTVLYMGNKTAKIYRTATLRHYTSEYLRIQTSTFTSQAFPNHIETKINEEPDFIENCKNLRNSLFREGFALAMQQLSKSGQCDIIKEEYHGNMFQQKYPNIVVFQDFIENKKYYCQLLEQFDLKSQKSDEENVSYSCSCHLAIFKGVPCKHLWKLCKLHDLNVQQYISAYWKLKYTHDEVHLMRILKTGVYPKKRGKPKSTHTNKIK